MEALENSSLDRQTTASIAFKKEVQELRRRLQGSGKEHADLDKRLKHIKKAVQLYPGAELSWMKAVKAAENISHATKIKLYGDMHKSKRDVETIPGTAYRVENIVWNTWYSTADPTTTNKEQFALATEEYQSIRKDLDRFKTEVLALESKLDDQNILYTPGRKNWKEE